jgi:hypothetical protein
MAYLTVEEIRDQCALLHEQFPDVISVATLPEVTWEGRPMQFVRIHAGGKANRHGFYVEANIHATEWPTADAAMHFIDAIVHSLANGTDMVFGGKTFAAADIRTAFDRIELFVLPCVNPDGRDFSMQSGVDERGHLKVSWRHNRRDNGNDCFGVDLNRNFDWLWNFPTQFSAAPIYDAEGAGCQGIVVVSDDVCNDDQVYHGPSPFSEPETRNIKRILDDHPHIRVFVDLHGVLGKVMIPWADDEVQTTDPEQHFGNTAFDGKRGLRDALLAGCDGTADPDGVAYREFMHPVDQARYSTFATAQRDAIFDVQGTSYGTGISYLEMYGMSGNSHDYAYSRHLADPNLNKIDGYIYEFADQGGFQLHPPSEDPPGEFDLVHLTDDLAAGLTQLLLDTQRIPIIEYQPRTLDFGRLRHNTLLELRVQLDNLSDRNIDVGPATMIGDAGPFSVAGIDHPHPGPGEHARIFIDVSTDVEPGTYHGRVAIEFHYHGESVRDVRIVPCKVDVCNVARGACVAPVFAGSSAFTCLIKSAVWAVLIAVLTLFAFFDPKIGCTIRQLKFRIRNCRRGNADPCRTL